MTTIDKLENLEVRKSKRNNEPIIQQGDRVRYKKLVNKLIFDILKDAELQPVEDGNSIMLEIWNESLEQFVTVMVETKIKSLNYQDNF